MAFTVDSLFCTGSGTFGSLTLPANSVLNANVASTAAIDRSKLALESLASFAVPFNHFRVWDAMATNLPGTAADDDLGFTGGTWGTSVPHLTTSDFEGTTVTQRARVQIFAPENFITGEDFQFSLTCKVSAAAQVSATVDVEAFLTGYDGAVTGADICATAAQSINSTTAAGKAFVLSGVTPGALIDVRVTIAGDDTGGTGAITAIIGGAFILCDIRG